MTIPLTYVLTKSWFSDPTKKFPRIQSDYKPKHAGFVAAQRSKERSQGRRWMLLFFVLVGFAVMFYTAYLIHYVETPAINRVWNPYDILGIAEVCAHAP